ncbi:TPM domain-containing protein [Flavobacterium sp. WLB]|uniref:TPM domain-containing protein n=1 Tax=Flavobacterium panici TaxID=2654843 RepID=A0A9N8J2Q2_9FLAO|nr:MULTISPECIES: TPM domain-containing protein [Flavobacterium]KOP39595.1 methanol dehydrogenase [Flavobacterium sp. VMW]OWU90146.1 methanol dehydrogenase [Flavobacterium sp. NLM]PUU69296.1 TPM domain-containing protein [Flavobacterium sp. WLB]UUF16484.1 TPM domain-containing protein [Flavobacterium panici]CAC9975186.1 TPM domain-containing protein [Flavobacterium panici]
MKNSNNKILNSNRIFQFTLLLITLFISNSIFAQFDIPKKPDFQTSVYDYANVLSAAEKTQLEEKLVRYSDSTSTQIVVITIESLKGEDIGILTPKWAQEWGIGQAKEDNGVLILLAKAEKRIWISPGYGLEDRLTAGIGGEITRNIIIPEFKAGSYYRGLDKGADALFDVFKGKYKGERKQSKGKDFPILPFIVIVVIVLILLSRGKRGGGNSGSSGGGPSLMDVILLSSLGRSSGGGFGGFGGGSSGGGGGFGGGFGGGGFSGGGSGGSW